MSATLDTPFENIEWTNVADAAGPILRTAAAGAIVNQPRLELRGLPRGEVTVVVQAAVAV